MKRTRKEQTEVSTLDTFVPSHGTADQGAVHLSRQSGIISVRDLPDNPVNDGKYYFTVNPSELEYYTLPFFKFPARFFPLIPRWIIKTYSSSDQIVLDPFCGSGSGLVEAKLQGRNSFGVDIDPLGRFLTKVKTTPIAPERLDAAWSWLDRALGEIGRRWDIGSKTIRDITNEETASEIDTLELAPYLPGFENNPPYWFRNYVFVELLQIKQAIHGLPKEHDGDCMDFFLGCFAASIRRASNADPSAVSGLEYTKKMREKDEKGRKVDPLKIFRHRVNERIEQMNSFYAVCVERDILKTWSKVIGEDIHEMQGYLQKEGYDGSVDLIVTSPPYCTAIEYYRRHKVELVWLREETGLNSFDDVREHSKHYIGRYMVSAKETISDENSPLLSSILDKLEKLDIRRARAISAYFQEMNVAFRQMSLALKKGGIAGVVIGDSTSKGLTIPTADIYLDLAAQNLLVLEKSFAYVIRNRIMQFARKNHGGKIDYEKILIFKKQ